MKINKSTLIKYVIIFELIVIIIGLLFIPLNKQKKYGPSVLVIDVHGEIASEYSDFYNSDFWGYNSTKVSAEEIVKIMQHYEKDYNIKAFILDIDSNGGDGIGQDILISQMHQMKKPVIAVIRDQALSSGYYVASATKRIFANELSNIADIGHTSIIEYTKDNKSYKKCYVSSSDFKRMYYNDCEGFEQTQIYKEQKKHLIEATKIMAKEIAKFRNLPENHVLTLSDGTIFTGIGALKLGLIDEIGGIHEAVDWLEKELGMELGIVYYREILNR